MTQWIKPEPGDEVVLRFLDGAIGPGHPASSFHDINSSSVLTYAQVETAMQKMREDTSQPEHHHLAPPGGTLCVLCGWEPVQGSSKGE